MQVAPTASEVPQVVVNPVKKSLAFGPETATLVMACVVSPLVTVTVCDWLVVLRLCAAKIRPFGLREKPSRMLTLAMYASQFPPGTAWSGLARGSRRNTFAR